MKHDSFLGAAIAMCVAVVVAVPVAAPDVAAQPYRYLPTGSTTDQHFLSLAGGDIKTIGENTLMIKLASPAASSTIELGIFDGDTRGIFDQGTTPLTFTLYADPNGDATGTTVLGAWSGDTLTDNGWYTITKSNAAAARCGSGDYFYLLKIVSSNPEAFHWSSFKLRTTGTMAVAAGSNISFSAPLGNALDAAVVYPSYPTLSPTNYNGVWHLYLDVTRAPSNVAIWDGDFDRGSYDCSDNDTDDDDTPNSLPAWADNDAVAEGVAGSSVACLNALGVPTGGTTTSNPPDDSRNAVFARASGVSYELITSDGTHYANNNPSGNLEWEQFRISTATFARSSMDYHADNLPAGTYELVINGLDLSNLNTIRSPFDILAVDSSGNAVTPLRPDYANGSISGVVYLENGEDCSKGLLDVGLPLVTVRLAADFNNDGTTDQTWSTTTSVLGAYSFSGLHPGLYTVTVDAATLPPATGVVCDSDGDDTQHSVRTTLTMCTISATANFGYEELNLLGAMQQ